VPFKWHGAILMFMPTIKMQLKEKTPLSNVYCKIIALIMNLKE